MKKLTLLFTLSFLLLAGMRLQAQDTIPALNYSSSSGVDPDATFKHLTSIDDGDWMEYSMYTSEETEYLLFFNILNSNPGYGAIEIVIDGGVVDTMYLPNTYGMWNNAVPAPIFIAAGNHTLRLNVLEGGWDFNHLAFNSYMGSGGNLYVPGQIDAEDYADMYRAGVGICEETVNINMLEFGTSYTDYFVDVWEAGNYLINVRYANGNAGTAYIDFYLDETYLTAVNTAYTGDWCTFTIATTEDSVFLSEGFYTLRVYSYGGDIDWINISKDDLSETPSGTSWYDVESNWIIGNIDGASQTIDGIIATSYDNGGYGNWAQWDAQYSLNQQENILNISYKRTEGDNSYGSFAFVLGEAENNGGDNTRISDDTYYGNLINMDYNPLIKVKIKSENTMTLQFTLTDVNGRNNNGNVINIQVDASTEWIEYVWDFSMTSNVNKYHPYFWNQYNGRDTWADPSVEIPIDLSQIAQIQVMVNPGVVENNFINFQMTDLQIGTTGGGGINLDPIYDFDGNEYNVVQIGDQVWMASNLRTTSFNDGSSILMLTDNTEWEMVTGPAYCWYENDQATYGDIYGALYNGYAVLNENLCPTGWKIATYDDWMVLENYLTGQGYNSGTALKDDVNWDGTNDFGFSAQPGSARDYNGTWQGAIGSYGQYWTPTAETGENLWYKMFETGFADIGSYTGGKNIGFSVRCIKGENTGNITIPAHIEAESYIEQFITVQFSTEEGKNQGIEYTGNQSYTKYNINVPISGEYNIILYVSSIYEEGMVTVNYNYNPVGEIAVPNTRDVNVWYEIRIDNVYLDAGENMPLQIVNSSNVTWNLNWVDFQSSGAGGDVLTIDDLNLSVGESYTMYAYYSPSYNPAAITSWGSDNYMVATIDASGTVYAKSAGQAKITAFDETGASARATVFVTDGGGGGMIYTPEPTDRFATWVQNYSSQWGDPSWAAYQATGFPNSYPNYGDISSAWASSYPDNQREYIELGFDNPKPINYIKVFETYNPGSIDTIYAWNGNSWDILYQEPAAYVGEFSRILDIRFPTTSYDVSLVRLALNSPAVYGYNEIDAVAIGNTTPPQPFTVYYNNSAGWSNVGLWVWNDKTSTSLFGSWPGELMTYNDTTGWFSYEIPGEYTNVIFNNYDLTFNDGHQTADLYRNSTGWFDGRIWYDEMPVTIEQPEYAYKTGRIEAENYDAMGGSLPGWDGSTGVVLEECYDVGGGFDVGYIDRFDWMEYAVNIPQEGDYYLNLRVANYENYNASVQVLIDGVLIGDVRTYIPVTNGWQNFETMAQYYYLPAGNHVLTLYCYDGSWNINWLEISTEDLSTSATSGWEKLKANWTIQDNSTRITGLVATQNPNTYGNWTCDESSYTLSWIGDSVLDVYCNRSDDELMWTGFKFNLGNISYGENYSAMSDDIYTGYTLDLSQKPKITIKVKNTGTDYIDLRLDLIDVNGHASNYSSYFAYTYPEESDFVYYEFTVYPDYLLDQWSPEWWEQNNNREVWDPNFTDLIPVDMTKIAQLYFMINPGNGYVNANLQITDLWLGTVVKDPPAEYVDLYTEEITLGVNEAYALEQHKDFYVYPENADLSTIFAQSRDESVATFSQGLISANGEGSTYIVFTPEKAYSEYDIDSILVNVLPEGEYTAVKGVVIESDENTVFEQGSWYYLYAYVLPADATNPGIVWSSTNEDVIYFDEWGNMYANSPGTCTIRASSSVNSTIFDEMTVTVSPVQIWLLELYPEYTTIASNSTFYPEVYYEPSYIADAKFIWTSSNTNIATVDQFGKITAKDTTGQVIIKAHAESNMDVFDYIAINITEDGSLTKWDELSYNWTINDYSQNVKGIIASDNEYQYEVTWTSGWDGQYNVNRKTDSTFEVNYSRNTTSNVWSNFNCELGWVSFGNDWKGLYDDYFYGYTVDMLQNPVVKLKIKSPQAFDMRIDLIDVNGHATNGNYITVPIAASTDWVEYVFDFSNLNLVDLYSNNWWGNDNGRYNWNPVNEPIPVDITKIAGMSIHVDAGIVQNKNFTFQINHAVFGTVDETKELPIQYFDIYEYEISLNVGGSYQLTTYFEPENATNKTLQFTSSNTSVATVDSKGKVYAKASGSAIISAFTQDGTGWSDIAYVYVNQNTVEVTSIALNTSVLNVPIGATDNSVVATVYPTNASNKNIQWSSGDYSIAFVNSTGGITGVGVGTTVIMATSVQNPEIFNFYTVEVTAARLNKVNLLSALFEAEAVSVNAANNIGTAVGQYPQTAYDLFNSKIDAAWLVYSTATTQAEIDASTANIIAATATFKNSIIGSIPVTSLVLNTKTLQLTTKSSPALLTVSITPVNATNKSIAWSSSNSSIVKVDGAGIITPVGGGTAKIYAKTKDGTNLKDSCVITVSIPVESISILASVGIKTGSTFTLTPNILPVNATNKTINWTSQNTAIATVDKNGVVTAKAVGVVNITAASPENNLSAVCVVTVEADNVVITSINLPDEMINTVAGKSIVIPFTVTPSNATNTTLVWSTSDVSLIINQSGLLTTSKGITGKVYARTQDGTIKDSVFVYVAPSLPPVVSSIPDFTMLIGTDSLNINLANYVADDKTSDANLKFQATAATNYTTNIKSGILTVKPVSESWIGSEQISITVTDQDNLVSWMKVTVHIADAANEAPVISTIPAQVVKVGNGFLPVNLTAYVTDDYTLPEDIQWTVTSTTNLFAFIISGKLYIDIADLSWVGTDNIYLTAKDEGGLSSTQISMACTVSDIVNKAPVITAIPVQERTDAFDFGTIALNNYVTDDFTPKEYIKWKVSSSTKINITITNNYASVTIIDNNWMGSESVTYTATDQDGASATVTVTYNQKRTVTGGTWTGAPVVSFYADRTVVGVGSNVNLHGSITGEADDYAWTLPGGIPDESSDLDPVIQYNIPGLYDVTFIAVSIDGESFLADTMVKTNYIRVVGIANPDTTICYGDSITLIASDLNLSSYKWTTGSTTISTATSIKVAPLSTTQYILTSQNILTKYYDTVTVTVDVPLNLGPDTAICNGESVVFVPQGYTIFNWNSGASSAATFTATTTGDVALTATNALGCTYSDVAHVTVNPVPVVNLGADITVCWGTDIDLDAGAGTGYTYDWSTQEATQTIVVDTTGIYSVTVTNTYNCSQSDAVSVLTKVPYSGQKLFTVTVDEEEGKNMILWEKTPNQGIATYDIWKETADSGVYELLASVDADQYNQYIDNNSDPRVTSNKYKISVTDTCGHRSALSHYHKTIHLTINAGSAAQGGNNLIWNAYEGTSVGTYYIYRGTSPSTMEELTKQAANAGLNSYTDLTPPAGDLYYQIVIELDDTLELSNRKKASAGPYSRSSSNMEDNRLRAGGEHPTAISLSASVVDEGLPVGTIVGQLITTDPDEEDEFTYELVSGEGSDDNASFTIDGESLKTAAIFDADVKNSYSIRVKVEDLGGNTLESSLVITINPVTGIIEITGNGTMQIFPNPFTKFATIQSTNANEVIKSVEVYDMIGNLKGTYTDINSNQFRLNKDNLGTGMFTIRVTGDSVYMMRVVIQ